jgi:hypothetical protein
VRAGGALKRPIASAVVLFLFPREGQEEQREEAFSHETTFSREAIMNPKDRPDRDAGENKDIESYEIEPHVIDANAVDANAIEANPIEANAIEPNPIEANPIEANVIDPNVIEPPQRGNKV